jgi:alkylation response protein AidB-like acyl-CoA dehydrogenase
MIFNEDQRALKEAARKFSREQLAPKYQQREREARVDRDLVREMGSLGLIGMDMPERYGGMDADAVTTGAIMRNCHTAISMSARWPWFSRSAAPSSRGMGPSRSGHRGWRG